MIVAELIDKATSVQLCNPIAKELLGLDQIESEVRGGAES